MKPKERFKDYILKKIRKDLPTLVLLSLKAFDIVVFSVLYKSWMTLTLQRIHVKFIVCFKKVLWVEEG